MWKQGLGNDTYGTMTTCLSHLRVWLLISTFLQLTTNHFNQIQCLYLLNCHIKFLCNRRSDLLEIKNYTKSL